jgi:Protein of unknown function (DUF4038)
MVRHVAYRAFQSGCGGYTYGAQGCWNAASDREDRKSFWGEMPWPEGSTFPARNLTNRALPELLDTQYQFDEPFIVDTSKIANELGGRATPVQHAIADTLAAYRKSAAAAAS